MRIMDTVNRTCLERWPIGKDGERESRESELSIQLDDHDDDDAKDDDVDDEIWLKFNAKIVSSSKPDQSSFYTLMTFLTEEYYMILKIKMKRWKL